MGGIAKAVGGLFGGGGDDAAEDAAAVQSKASDAAIAEQRRQFDLTREDLAPSIGAGNLARDRMQAFLGLPGFDQQAAFDNFLSSPGQAFLQQQGEKALLRNASAIGGLGGGNIRQALVQQGIGFASQDYNNQFNQLAGLAGAAQTALTNQAQFGANSANNISSLLQDQGAARASGILGAQQAKAQAGSNLISTGLGVAGLFGGFGGLGAAGGGAGGAITAFGNAPLAFL